MIEKAFFLGHHPFSNFQTQEVIPGTGMGSSGQWGVVLIVMLAIGIFLYFSRKKNKGETE